jgi:hypothetical protein
MSEINRPKKVVADDDYIYITEELAEKYDYDGELEDDELFEHDFDESVIVNNYDNYINMDQILQDESASNTNNYKPPQIIRVLERTARTLPSGQIVLDYQLEVEEIYGAKTYEVRVLEI